jgi:hypothetical protein
MTTEGVLGCGRSPRQEAWWWENRQAASDLFPDEFVETVQRLASMAAKNLLRDATQPLLHDVSSARAAKPWAATAFINSSNSALRFGIRSFGDDPMKVAAVAPGTPQWFVENSVPAN